MAADLLYNILMSGSISATALLANYALGKRARIVAMEPNRRQSQNDELVEGITMGLEDGLRRLLKTEVEKESSKRGPTVNNKEIIKSQVKEKLGIVHKEVFDCYIEVPDEYQFMVNYTTSTQKGLTSTQPYVVALAKALTKGIIDIDQQVAVNAVGKDLVIVKTYQEPLDYRRFDQVASSHWCNYNQCMDKAARIEHAVVKKRPTIIFNIVNGQVRLTDKRYEQKEKHLPKTRMFTYLINDGPMRSPEHSRNALTAGYAVKSLDELVYTFNSFLQTCARRQA